MITLKTLNVKDCLKLINDHTIIEPHFIQRVMMNIKLLIMKIEKGNTIRKVNTILPEDLKELCSVIYIGTMVINQKFNKNKRANPIGYITIKGDLQKITLSILDSTINVYIDNNLYIEFGSANLSYSMYRDSIDKNTLIYRGEQIVNLLDLMKDFIKEEINILCDII